MTNSWRSLNLGDAIMAHQPLEQIREVFEQFVIKNGSTNKLAIFTRNDSEGRLHCEVTAYFSPDAGEIARLLKASPCEKPTSDNLDLFAGDENCKAVLFP